MFSLELPHRGNSNEYTEYTTIKVVLVATSIKRATCIKQACIEFPIQVNILKCILY